MRDSICERKDKLVAGYQLRNVVSDLKSYFFTYAASFPSPGRTCRAQLLCMCVGWSQTPRPLPSGKIGHPPVNHPAIWFDKTGGSQRWRRVPTALKIRSPTRFALKKNRIISTECGAGGPRVPGTRPSKGFSMVLRCPTAALALLPRPPPHRGMTTGMSTHIC